MKMSSKTPRYPSARAGFDFAPVAPLPRSSFPGPSPGHYTRHSTAEHLSSQSGSSVSDSEEEQEERNPSSSNQSDHCGDDNSDGGNSASDTTDASDSSSSSSFGDRSSSQSSLYDAEEEESNATSDDDGIAIISSSRGTTWVKMSGSAPRAFWQTDNLGVLALLIPITGISTMLLTEVLACYNHFDCSTHYPTLSYAAEFKPEGHAFTIGMCTTAIFIMASIALFHWFLRLKLLHPTVDSTTRVISHTCLVSGSIAAGSLFGLAVMDMGAYHDAHIAFTVLFFIFAWVTMASVQSARRRLLRDDEVSKLVKPVCTQVGGVSGIRATLRRWNRMTILSAYQLGRIFLYAGLTATGLFAFLFLCVNGVWPNPLGFTAIQEALLEAFAIFCQLFFMGTLSCELSMLTRVIEHRDYQELERAE